MDRMRSAFTRRRPRGAATAALFLGIALLVTALEGGPLAPAQENGGGLRGGDVGPRSANATEQIVQMVRGADRALLEPPQRGATRTPQERSLTELLRVLGDRLVCNSGAELYPDPKEYAGKTLIDRQTYSIYCSNGTRWVYRGSLWDDPMFEWGPQLTASSDIRAHPNAGRRRASSHFWGHSVRFAVSSGVS